MLPESSESDNTYYTKLTGSHVAGAGWRRLRGGLASASIDRFWAKVNRADGCWLWTAGTFKNGYGMFAAGRYPDGKMDVRYAHRLAWELTYGEIPLGLQVRHSCDVKRCCNPEHLQLGTHADNMHDCVVRGRKAKQYPGAWLLPKDVRPAVIEACLTGPRGTIARLAAEHAISQQALATAVRRERKARELSHAVTR